ncbi:MAG: hypothetical protein QNJ12_10025 [Ilumatobacter sp.]|uniref:hypothetical protein n=1 Tax=Ilumatobacter sp. TaxID=1967498 RepID=UPI0026190840|nr:hypothetical protein [Ilumatobacter sp.]MDJ0769123.1 hypothetical protein [Ilumatobacter sp.]
MTALSIALVWSACGVIAALTDGHERAGAWVAAGALMGPLWLIVCADRPVADRLQPVRIELRPSRLLPRDRPQRRGRRPVAA